MANSDPLEIRLIDPDLLTTHGILPLMRADYYVQLNEPGSGNFEISTGSSLSSSVESDAFADVFYRGSSRGGFLVENISRAHANSSEGGGRTVTASGRGSLALMEDAIVWDDGTGSTERTFSGTQAATLITLMQEAQNRGGLQNIIWDFSATNDTDSVAWTDDEDLVLTVGTSLLDVIRQISDNGIDFDISRSGDEFTLHAYKNGAGSDKSSTVYFRVGQNCEEVSSDEVGGDIRNVLKTKYEGGYTTVSNSASILARRRREGLLDARYAQSTSTARTFAAAHLDGKKDPKHQISIKVYDGVGPRVFVDYELGDTITLDIDGTETEYRIRGMHLHWDNSEYASVTLTMNDDIMENEIKLTREFNRLKTDFTSARDADLLEVSFWAAIGDPNITYTVNSLVISAGVLYVASLGSILTYDLDNGGWTRVLTVSDTIMCIAVNGSDIYFGTVTGNVYKHSGGTTTQIGNSAMSSDPGFESIFCMVNFNGAIYVGGYFDSMSSVSTNGFAVYSGGSWSDGGGVGSFLNADTDGVNILASTGATVKVFDGASWSSLGDPSALTVSCVAIYGTQYLAGTAANIYLYDGSWAVFEGGVTGNVNAISVYLTDVYVGGSFTDRGSKIAKCSGGEWFELEQGVNGNVSYLAMRENDLYVSGAFTTAGDKNAQGIAAYLQNFDSLTNYLEHAPGEFNLGEAIHNATAKTSLTGDDEMPLWDSVSKALRKITWTNIIASIKTWADTIYVSLTGNQTIAGVKTFSSDPLIPDEAYDATAWNGSLEPPTKNAVRDKIESMGGGGGTPGGSDTEVQYNDSGAFGGDAEFTFDNVNKVVSIGDMSLIPMTAKRTLRLAGYSVSPSVAMHAFGSDYAPFLSFYKSDLSAGPTFTNVKNNQVIGRVRGRGWDGSAWTGTRLEMRFVADGDWASGDTPTKIEFYTCPDGSGTLTLAMTIRSDGHVDIATGKEYRVNGAQHPHAASDITSGTMATARLGSGTANAGTFLSGDQTYKPANTMIAKNTSGATANAGDVGYINEDGEYKTTTTAQAAISWVVVIIGGANNADIYITRRGRVNVNYTGSAPAAGDFLVTSTSAGLAQAQTTMRPEIFAVCLASGSGGVVSVLLLTQTVRVSYTSSNVLYRCNSHSSSTFVATINGSPTATSVVYNAPSSGNEDVIVPNASTELAKRRLYNSTRGTYRLITAVNTGTNTITTISSSDAWASGDTITLQDNDINDSLTPDIGSFDLSQQTEIPLLARAIEMNALISDTGGAGAFLQLHPLVAYNVSKLSNAVATQSTGQNYATVPMDLINQKFGARQQATGTGTCLTILKVTGYYEAQP